MRLLVPSFRVRRYLEYASSMRPGMTAECFERFG